ncbi:HdeD family acid-resistance protein [Aequorivita capsosiphonis]|uniref:HdeD family acid-resistance protein n=1 Tax=Aequorivita capsosiphonis TaxID=487317 RepID=UPI0004219228|nr:HdeD family acid-resistance protein [Aequorivita capsosiphonis]
MQNSFLNSIKNTIKHWYIPLLVGILFVVVSIVVFTSPVSSLLTLSILFALSFLFGGLSEIIFSIANRKQLDNWGWSLAFGILTFIIGTSLIMHPGLSISVLAFYVGFLLLFRSISSISFAMDLKKYGSKSWGGLLIFGILGAIVSFVLIWNPVFAGMSVVILVALSFLFAGLFSIFLSFQLRKIHKSSKEISANLKERYNVLMEEIREEQNS